MCAKVQTTILSRSKTWRDKRMLSAFYTRASIVYNADSIEMKQRTVETSRWEPDPSVEAPPDLERSVTRSVSGSGIKGTSGGCGGLLVGEAEMESNETRPSMSASVNQDKSASVNQDKSASVNQYKSASVNQDMSVSVNQDKSASVNQDMSVSVNQELSLAVDTI